MKQNTRHLRDEINANIRFLAYFIFNHKGKPNFINAYDKLKAKLFLDYDINVSDRLKSSKSEDLKLFDVLSDHEVELAVKASTELVKMYKEVKAREYAC